MKEPSCQGRALLLDREDPSYAGCNPGRVSPHSRLTITRVSPSSISSRSPFARMV